MPNRGPKTGGGHLARKSALAIARAGKPAFEDILLVEDKDKEAARLTSTLNVIFNRTASIRRATTLAKALDAVIAKKPDLIFLDDILPPNDNALLTIPFVRRCGYEGPIVVVSSAVTRQRRALLGMHEHAFDLGRLIGAAHPALDAHVGAPARRWPGENR